MAGTIGVQFSVGAALSRTVASTFGTVGSRIKGLRSDLRTLETASRATAGVVKTRADWLKARDAHRASPTDKTAADLDRARRAYKTAAESARRYGISVREATTEQARLGERITRTDAALKRQQRLQANQNKRQELQGQMLGTVGMAMSVAAPFKLAMYFESSMADAAKTIDGVRDAAGKLTPKYYEMETAVKEMGRTLPLTHAELAGLFAAGGQQGMSGTAELKEFTTLSAQMSVAFGMSTEAAAEAIGGYRTALNLSMPQTREMLDLMNFYANTGSASEKGIAEVVRRVGSLGDVAGVSYKPMVALAATMDAMKIAPENAATGIQKLLLTMTKGTAATKSQQAAFARLGFNDTTAIAKQMQEDGPAAIMAVLRQVKALPQHMQASVLTELVGEEGVRTIAPLLNRLELLEQNLVSAADSTKYLGATQQEFENRNKTAANALILAKNRLSELGITLGSAVLPAMVQLLETVGPYITTISDFASRHQTATAVVFGVAAALVAFKVAALVGMYAGTMLSDAWTLAKGAAELLTRGQLRAAGATQTLTLWQRAGALASFSWGDAMRGGRAHLSAMGTGIRSLGSSFALFTGMQRGATLGTIMHTTVSNVCAVAAGGLKTVIRGLGMAFRFALGPVGLLISALTIGVGLIIDNWDTVGPYFETLWNGITGIFTSAWASIKTVVDNIVGAVSWVGESIDKTPVLGSAKRGIGKAWDWAFGDEASEVPAPGATAMQSKTTTPVSTANTAALHTTANLGGTNGATRSQQHPSEQDMLSQLAAGMTGQGQSGAASPVQLTQSFTLNGIADGAFAERVVAAVNSRRGDFEKLLSEIVGDQMRLSYGG